MLGIDFSKTPHVAERVDVPIPALLWALLPRTLKRQAGAFPGENVCMFLSKTAQISNAYKDFFFFFGMCSNHFLISLYPVRTPACSVTASS